MRRRYLTGGLLLAAVALLLVWRIGYHGRDVRLILWPPPEDEFAVPAALEEVSAINVTNMPLREALALLAKRHQVQIELDDFALADAILTGDEPVTLKRRRVRLKSLLADLVKDFGFEVRHRDGVIYITSYNAWDGRQQNFSSRVYRLDRLLAAPASPVHEKLLANLILANISPSTWEQAGGTGSLRTLPGALVVSHLPEVHEEIAALLDRLAEVFEITDPPTRVPAYDTFKPNLAISTALAELTEIDVIDKPLSELLAELEARHKIDIQIDTKALEGSGVRSDTTVTCKLKSISLRSALAVILSRLELTIMIKNDVLQVTTPEIADRAQSVSLYPVLDLVHGSGPPAYDLVIDLIFTTVAPNTWGAMGGAGEIMGVGGVLIISQTEDVHEEIESFLVELRRAMYPALGTPSVRSLASLAPLERALARPVSFTFEQVSLREAAEKLSELSGVNVVLDYKALEGIAVKNDALISSRAQGVPLEQAARQMVLPLGLATDVRWECLFITAPEIADNRLETRYYRVADLLPTALQVATPYDDDWEGLIDFVSIVVRPKTWADEGGAGSIEGFRNVLVVSQTREIHAELVELFSHLRRLSRGEHVDESLAVKINRAEDFPSLHLYDVRDLHEFELAGDCTTSEAILYTLAEEIVYAPNYDDSLGGFAQQGQIVAVWGDSSLHRRSRELLAVIRKAMRRPASATPLLSCLERGERLTAVYHVGDLRRAAGLRQSPLCAFDLTTGWLRGIQGLPTTTFFSRWPVWRADPLSSVLDNCLQDSQRESRYAFGYVLLGDLLVFDAGPGEREQVERFLASLRHVLIEHGPVSTNLSGARGAGQIISWRDIRPLLDKFPELDEWQIGEFVQRTVWEEFSAKNPYTYPLGVLPGVLVFSPPFAAADVDRVLDMLLNETGDLPRPFELARDDDRAVQARLTELVLQEQDSVRLAWLLWLAGLARDPDEKLRSAVEQRRAERIIRMLNDLSP